jgi:hypothetical protein
VRIIGVYVAQGGFRWGMRLIFGSIKTWEVILVYGKYYRLLKYCVSYNQYVCNNAR